MQRPLRWPARFAVPAGLGVAFVATADYEIPPFASLRTGPSLRSGQALRFAQDRPFASLRTGSCPCNTGRERDPVRSFVGPAGLLRMTEAAALLRVTGTARLGMKETAARLGMKETAALLRVTGTAALFRATETTGLLGMARGRWRGRSSSCHPEERRRRDEGSRLSARPFGTSATGEMFRCDQGLRDPSSALRASSG